jgi:hypothetical protein
MPNYRNIQIIGYGSVTSTPTQVLPDTEVNNFGLDATTRANTLCAVADWTRTAFDSKLGGSDTLKIFMVPEFYFRYGGPSDPPDTLLDSYPNAENALIPNIATDIMFKQFASPRYADWLIVAGSVFWHKSAQESGATDPTYFNTVIVIRGGPEVALSGEERQANGEGCQIPTMARVSTNQKALMSHIDYASGPGGDRRHQDAALNPMFAPILGDWEWWRWHAFGVHGVAGPTGTPLVFGLEVCLEHARATNSSTLGVLRTLQGEWPKRCSGAPMPAIDVQLVTSCGMSLQPSRGIAGPVNGIAAICDGHGGSRTWPNVDCERVTQVTGDGERNVALAESPLSTLIVPAPLQVGLAGQQHTPPDAVLLWEPLELLAAGA